MVSPVKLVAVPALPVTLPAIGLVTVKLVKVPTLVKIDTVTVDFKVVPVKVPASAVEVIVMSPLPSNATPFIFLAVANLVADPAVPSPFVIPPILVLVINIILQHWPLAIWEP